MFEYFYHERIRRSVAIFGSLFDNIYVINKDSSGKNLNQFKVPLSYAPKAKYIERLRENSKLQGDRKVALKLPRMSFEIVGFNYATDKQLSKSNTLNLLNNSSGNSSRSKIRSPAPYMIQFQLTIYAKMNDDALQIVEQIIPYFLPHYNLKIIPFDGISTHKEDIPITLNGVTYSDEYEGEIYDRRVIQYQLDFEMSANFYGPIDDNATIINKAQIDLGFIENDVSSRLTVLPNPLNANPDSDYGYTEIWENISDIEE